MTHVPSTLAAGLALAATAMGQAPAIDGTKDAVYGPALWINTQNPTGFGDNVPGNFPCDDFGSGINLAVNNSNIAGVPGGAVACAASGAGVTTGFEIKIPFAAIGNPTQATFKLAGFIVSSGHDFASNQVIGGSTTCIAGNLGEPRNINFDDTAAGLAGAQFVPVANGTDTEAAGPTIDGMLDAAFYGTPLWLSNTETAFGDNNTGQPGLANGSEIDGVYARVVTVGAEKLLYIFITGNLETNFNKVWLFIDTVSGQGQPRLLGNNVGLDFNGLNRLGEDPAGAGNGLRFDAGFDADFALTFTNGGTPTQTFANFGSIPTNGGGTGRYVGSANNPAPIVVAPCVPTPRPVPSPDKAYGSEFDAAYGIVCDNFLHLFIAGNLEVNGNRIDLFFDVDNTTLNEGQQTLRGDNVAVDNVGLLRMGNKPEGGPPDPNTSGGPEGQGLTFDAGFKADYWLAIRNTGTGAAEPTEQGAHAAILRSGGAAGNIFDFQGLLDYGSFVFADKAVMNPLSFDGSFCVRRDMANNCAPNGAGSAWNPSSIAGIDVQGDFNATVNNLPPLPEIFSSFAPRLISANPFDPLGTQSPNPNLTFPGLIQLSINNSNIAGVSGDAAVGADQVSTGIEIRIRIDELGWDGASPIRVVGFINAADHSILSNQVLGGLPAAANNLGEPRGIDFGLITGDQFITIPVGPCVAVQTGACCSGGSCSLATQVACTGTFTRYAGNGTVCNAPGNSTAPCCKADYNQSGGVTVQDIFDFLGGYFSQNPQADINGVGGVTVQDIFDFLAVYFAGCN